MIGTPPTWGHDRRPRPSDLQPPGRGDCGQGRRRPDDAIDPRKPLGGIPIDRRIAPDAPLDTYGGIGFGDQRIYVVPSHRAVVVRLGGPTVVAGERPRSIDIELWRRLDLSTLPKGTA